MSITDPSSVTPNSNFVSARMMPHDSACALPNAYSSSVNLLSVAMSVSPTSRPASASLMFTSWPLVAFVAGVKIGCGSRSDSRIPAGSSTPHTAPVAR